MSLTWGEVSVCSVTSEKAEFQDCVFKRSFAKEGTFKYTQVKKFVGHWNTFFKKKTPNTLF